MRVLNTPIRSGQASSTEVTEKRAVGWDRDLMGWSRAKNAAPKHNGKFKIGKCVATKGLTGAIFGCVANKGVMDAFSVSVAGKGLRGFFRVGERLGRCR